MAAKAAAEPLRPAWPAPGATAGSTKAGGLGLRPPRAAGAAGDAGGRSGGSSTSPDPPLLPAARRLPARLLPPKFPFLRGEAERGGGRGARAAGASLTAQQTQLGPTALRHRLHSCAFPRCRRGARRRPPRRRPQTPPQRPARRCPLSGRGARRRRRSRPLPAPVPLGVSAATQPPDLLLLLLSPRSAPPPPPPAPRVPARRPPRPAEASPARRAPAGPPALSFPGERGGPRRAGPALRGVSAAAGLGHQGDARPRQDTAEEERTALPSLPQVVQESGLRRSVGCVVPRLRVGAKRCARGVRWQCCR